MASNHKGHRKEREYLDMVTSQGMIAHRVAGSGRGEDAICDIIAVDLTGEAHFIEVKSRKKVFYTKQHLDQLNTMMEAAKKCNAKPVLAVFKKIRPNSVMLTGEVRVHKAQKYKEDKEYGNRMVGKVGRKRSGEDSSVGFQGIHNTYQLKKRACRL